MTGKKVPVFVGEGNDRIEIGRAGIETLPDGTNIVNISIENPTWGGWSIGGFAPMRLTGIIPINHLERNKSMPSAEERQARALEKIAVSADQLTKIMAKLNENFVGMFAFIKQQIEKDEAHAAANAGSPDDMRAQEELRVQYEREAKHRADRLEHEESMRRDGTEVFTTTEDQLKAQYQALTGEEWKEEAGDPIQDKVDANEFNKPGPSPFFQRPTEGSE